MALRHASAERGGSGGARAGTGRAGRAAPGGRRRDAHPPRLAGAGRGGADRRALRGGARRRGFKPVAGYLQHGGLVPESRSVTHPGDSVAAARRIRPSASQARLGNTMVLSSTTRTSRGSITSPSSGHFRIAPTAQENYFNRAARLGRNWVNSTSRISSFAWSMSAVWEKV